MAISPYVDPAELSKSVTCGGPPDWVKRYEEKKRLHKLMQEPITI